MRDTYFDELDGALVAIEDGDVRSVVCDGAMCGEFRVPEDSAVVWEIGGGLRFVLEPVAIGGDFGVAKDGMVDELGNGVVSVFVFGRFLRAFCRVGRGRRWRCCRRCVLVGWWREPILGQRRGGLRWTVKETIW